MLPWGATQMVADTEVTFLDHRIRVEREGRLWRYVRETRGEASPVHTELLSQGPPHLLFMPATMDEVDSTWTYLSAALPSPLAISGRSETKLRLAVPVALVVLLADGFGIDTIPLQDRKLTYYGRASERGWICHHLAGQILDNEEPAPGYVALDITLRNQMKQWVEFNSVVLNGLALNLYYSGVGDLGADAVVATARTSTTAEVEIVLRRPEGMKKALNSYAKSAALAVSKSLRRNLLMSWGL